MAIPIENKSNPKHSIVLNQHNQNKFYQSVIASETQAQNTLFHETQYLEKKNQGKR